jgi:hypothetical protein
VADERALKVLSTVLENTASDGETLFHLLDTRAYGRGSQSGFVPTPVQLPRPPFPPKDTSAALAVTYAKAILQGYATVLAYFKLAPSTASPLDPHRYGEGGLLDLIINWQSLRAGLIKLIITQYGGRAEDYPHLQHAGPASADRLWAEIAAWLKKIAADVESFLTVQGLTPGHVPAPPAPTPSLIDSMVALEQTFHQATLDAARIIAALPYHLYHTAHR